MRTIGDYKIHHWDELEGSFKEADIFLGNGFSININGALNYRSLFERFLNCLSPKDREIFKRFNSTNFEAIQNSLTDALYVNSVFNKPSEEIKEAVLTLKSGLMNSIKDLHPNYSTVDPLTIHTISQKLDHFEDIYTTNYDIFLYHILLTTLDRCRKNRLIPKRQDFFRKDEEDLAFNQQSLPGFRKIYYLHGALFLFNEGGKTIKIWRGSKTDELLDLIRLRIHLGQIPVFVSEGKSILKEETIFKNPYLSFCRDAFRKARRLLVIHGFSFSGSDDHLITDLNKNRRRLAIGLHMKNQNGVQTIRTLRHITEKLYKLPLREIKFYDSTSLF